MSGKYAVYTKIDDVNHVFRVHDDYESALDDFKFVLGDKDAYLVKIEMECKAFGAKRD